MNHRDPKVNPDAPTTRDTTEYYMNPYLNPSCCPVESAHKHGMVYSDFEALTDWFGRFGLSESASHQEPVLDHRQSNYYNNNNINQFPSGPGMMNGHAISLHPPAANPHDYPRHREYLRKKIFEKNQNRLNGFDPNQRNESYGRDRFGLSFNGSHHTGNLGGEVPLPSRNSLFDPNYYARNDGSSIYNPSFSSILWRARDRQESKMLQDLIEGGSREIIDEIFDQVIAEVDQLMVDPVGCQAFQKLLLKLTNDQISKVLDMVIQNPHKFARICADPHGTRSVQDLMHSLRGEEQIAHFMFSVCHTAIMLTKNTNAYHVILSSLSHFTPDQSRCLLQVIFRNCFAIASDQHGCCMIQQCIGKSSGEIRRTLIEGIIVNALGLSVNCYGNYVVQYVLELEDAQVAATLVKQLEGHFVHLSRDKYGSHTVQKCLKNRECSPRRIILDELMPNIDGLLVDPFGNYVMQTAWSVSLADVRDLMYYHITRNAQLMRCNRYGKKVLDSLQKVSSTGGAGRMI